MNQEKQLLRDKLLDIDEYKDINYKAFIYPHDKLPHIEDKTIITLDKYISPDRDGAFSIEKKDDLYFFNVYITDVPSVLLLNEDLFNYAYKRGTSMYNKQHKGELLIYDMLPYCLSHKALSLRKRNQKGVITFSYIIDQKGNIYLNDIFRSIIMINKNISPDTINIENLNDKNIEDYKNMCELVCSKTEEKHLKDLKTKCVDDLVAFPSVLTNYQIGKKSNFAIYRENGFYKKESENKYTHSVTPLRKFASNINLIMYLNQLSIINCPDKYIYWIEDNIDSIIKHLNNEEELSRCYEKSYHLIKNSMKKIKKRSR